MPYVRSAEGRFREALRERDRPGGWRRQLRQGPGLMVKAISGAVAALRVQIRTPNERSGPSRETPGHPAGGHWAGRRVTRVRFRKPNSNRGPEYPEPAI